MIRGGIGGGAFDSWRWNFYAEESPHKCQRECASRQGLLDIKRTFYRTQTAAGLAKWRDKRPGAFSAKAPRDVTDRAVLGAARDAVERYMTRGTAPFGTKIGPIVGPFARGKRFDAGVRMLSTVAPVSMEGRRLQHVLEISHESFARAEFVALVRGHGFETRRAVPDA